MRIIHEQEHAEWKRTHRIRKTLKFQLEIPVSYPAKARSSIVKRGHERLRVLYRLGYSIREIAEWTGVSRETVRKLLIKLDVPMRPRGRPQGMSRSGHMTIRDVVAMREALASGMSIRKAARQWGLSRVAVQDIAHNRSWTDRDGHQPLRAAAPD